MEKPYLKLVWSRPSRFNKKTIMEALAYTALGIFTVNSVLSAALLLINHRTGYAYLFIPATLLFYWAVHKLMWD